jgi:hypothetical protein
MTERLVRRLLRSMWARAAIAAAASWLLFVFFFSLLLSVLGGGFVNPISVAVSFVADVIERPRAALQAAAEFWLGPLAVGAVAVAASRSLLGRGRRREVAALAVFLTTAIGLAFVLTMRDGWAVLTNSAAIVAVGPRLLTISAGFAAIGLLVFWAMDGAEQRQQ